jgi:hypothetical protein
LVGKLEVTQKTGLEGISDVLEADLGTTSSESALDVTSGYLVDRE